MIYSVVFLILLAVITLFLDLNIPSMFVTGITWTLDTFAIVVVNVHINEIRQGVVA